MKKICFITTVSVTLKTFVTETATYLHQNEDYDITFICNPDQNFIDSLPDYVHFIPVKMARGIDFSAFASIAEFYKIFKREKFDLIQYSTPNASCYASIAAFFARVPIRLYAQWGIRYVGLGGISRKIFKLIEKTVCKLSTDIRAVSHKNMQFGIDEKLYKPQKVSVIGNGGTIGVDMNDYNIESRDIWLSLIREKHNISKDDFVFGFAGRISIDKGCGELLEAFKNITENHKKAKLLIIGPNEQSGIDPRLLDWAQNSDSVIFTGPIEKQNMKMYYSALDVLVHPTYREGFGMVIQEAGALAVPAITTDIPGASEVMEGNISCLLVSAKSTAELQSAMTELLENNSKVSSLGKAAYNRTKALYDRPVMLEFQHQEYKKILNGEI